MFDAQLTQAEEACVRERERYEQESEEHSKTKDRASELQVSKHIHWQYTFHLKYRSFLSWLQRQHNAYFAIQLGESVGAASLSAYIPSQL